MTDAQKRQRAAELAGELEQALRELGTWADDPSSIPAPRGPFGADNVAFEQWLQVVLAERLRQVARGEADLPRGSQLSVKAAREFDGAPVDTSRLEAVLRDIDKLASRNWF